MREAVEERMVKVYIIIDEKKCVFEVKTDQLSDYEYFIKVEER